MATKKKSVDNEPIMEPQVVDEPKPAKKPAAKIKTVFGGVLNIRKDADINSERVGYYEDGDKIKVLEDLGDWLRVETGYVMAKWVK